MCTSLCASSDTCVHMCVCAHMHPHLNVCVCARCADACHQDSDKEKVVSGLYACLSTPNCMYLCAGWKGGGVYLCPLQHLCVYYMDQHLLSSTSVMSAVLCVGTVLLPSGQLAVSTHCM